MREFTKSMMSYTWGMSLFGVQQMVNVLTPPRQGQDHPATEAFNNVAQCAVEQMGDAMRATYRVGDNVQRGMADIMFGVFTLGMFDRGGRGGGSGGSGGGRGAGQNFGQQASNVGQQTAEAFRRGMGAMGQTVGVVGQAVGGAASGWGRGGGGSRRQQRQQQPSASTGWGPVPPPGSAR
jgi:hypothetical protein